MAWLLNLRGSDVPYNPVFIAYVLVTDDDATLYTDPGKVTAEVNAHLTTAGVLVKPYEAVVADLVALAKEGVKVLMDPSKVSLALYDAARAAAEAGQAAKDAGPRGKRKRSSKGGVEDTANGSTEAPAVLKESALVEKPSPVYEAKAIKNEQVRRRVCLQPRGVAGSVCVCKACLSACMEQHAPSACSIATRQRHATICAQRTSS